jgi:4-carboxymuconolactone decarboxylase
MVRPCPAGRTVGVLVGAIEANRRGEEPNFQQRDEALVYDVCSALFDTRRLLEETFNEAVTMLGETGLVQIIAIIGYYTLIGNTLNIFQVPIPEGATPPFPE